MADTGLNGKWALILGASSGFGGTVACRLSREGMNIFGVHLDRKATMPNAEKIQDEIRENGGEAVFFNINAAGYEERAGVIEYMSEHLGGGAPGAVRVMLHSLAFGTLKPFISEDGDVGLSPKQMDMTLDVMAFFLCQPKP